MRVMPIPLRPAPRSQERGASLAGFSILGSGERVAGAAGPSGRGQDFHGPDQQSFAQLIPAARQLPNAGDKTRIRPSLLLEISGGTES